MAKDDSAYLALASVKQKCEDLEASTNAQNPQQGTGSSSNPYGDQKKSSRRTCWEKGEVPKDADTKAPSQTRRGLPGQ